MAIPLSSKAPPGQPGGFLLYPNALFDWLRYKEKICRPQSLNPPQPFASPCLPRAACAEDGLEFLSACGLKVYKPNPRQYEARIPALPELHVLFQRPGDIVVSVRDGSVEFGITGIDVIEERKGENGSVLMLHDNLGFGSAR